MNYRLVAMQLGDLLKYSISLNEIGRIAESIFDFRCESFPINSISSSRAQLIYDWILSLEKQNMKPAHRDQLLIQFARSLTPDDLRSQIDRILDDARLSNTMSDSNETTAIIKILQYRNRHDLARLFKHSYHEIRESTSYGSHLFSVISRVEVYSPLNINEKLLVLSEEDKQVIFDAFLTLYPPKDHSPEIVRIDYLVNPHSELPLETSRAFRIADIDFEYIREQLDKCDEKLASGDFDGTMTNARTLVENICLYILEDSGTVYDHKGNLPNLYKQASKVVNMDPSSHTEQMFKQILSGFISAINGLASIRNARSDAHGRLKTNYYKPTKRHAVFVVDASKAISEFLYSSYIDNKS